MERNIQILFLDSLLGDLVDLEIKELILQLFPQPQNESLIML